MVVTTDEGERGIVMFVLRRLVVVKPRGHRGGVEWRW